MYECSKSEWTMESMVALRLIHVCHVAREERGMDSKVMLVGLSEKRRRRRPRTRWLDTLTNLPDGLMLRRMSPVLWHDSIAQCHEVTRNVCLPFLIDASSSRSSVTSLDSCLIWDCRPIAKFFNRGTSGLDTGALLHWLAGTLNVYTQLDSVSTTPCASCNRMTSWVTKCAMNFNMVLLRRRVVLSKEAIRHVTLIALTYPAERNDQEITRLSDSCTGQTQGGVT